MLILEEFGLVLLELYFFWVVVFEIVWVEWYGFVGMD